MAITAALRPDETLALEAARGDRRAFEELVRKYAGPIAAFCRDIVRDAAEAEDRAQEAFLRAYRGLATFDPSRPFSSWLYKIAQNACIDALRARPEPPPAPAPEGRPLGSDALGRLEAALEGLTAKQRMVLHYKYRLGLNAAEIAAQLGITHEDVRVTLHRAIRALRGRMSS